MKLLKELYGISSPSGGEKAMIRFIIRWLQKRNIRHTVDRFGNIYAIKGKSKTYPCIVAHTDEVHGRRSAGYEVVSFRGEIIFGYDSRTRKFTGIGADDKNGVWICLKCLEAFDVLKCVFFTGEETGCTGSRNAVMTFFDDCRYVIQCDRKGGCDLITEISGVKLCSDEFLKAMNPSAFGYKPAFGMMTDVLALKTRGLDISCVNIACGYYNPHSDDEYTDIRELKNCLRFVCSIVQNCTRDYPHRYKPPVYRRYPSSVYGRLAEHYETEELF